MKWIVYVDLDAYYVSCELRARPELRGSPVIVGPDPKLGPSRGVVLSASYEAREYGVRSAMPVATADRLCPSATWIPANFPLYGRVAREFRALLERHAGHVVPLSIDEAAVTIEVPDATLADRFARDLQTAIRTELELPASIGVAPFRVVAKIATDIAKPAGILVVPAAEVESFLAPLPVRSIPGIGPKTEAILLSAGVEKIGDLAEGADQTLRYRLGGFADELVALARGQPREPEVEIDPGPRSRSADRTFAEDLRDLEVLHQGLDELSTELSQSLESERIRYRTVTVAIRWADFSRVQRSRSLPRAIEGENAIREAARRLFLELWDGEAEGRGRAVRLLSVRVERLEGRDDRQLHLDAFVANGDRTIK